MFIYIYIVRSNIANNNCFIIDVGLCCSPLSTFAFLPLDSNNTTLLLVFSFRKPTGVDYVGPIVNKTNGPLYHRAHNRGEYLGKLVKIYVT